MGMISEDIIEDFFSNRMSIYCPNITLKQKVEEEGRIIYKGKGVIRKAQKGQFDLDFFPRQNYQLHDDYLKRRGSSVIGRLIPDSFYFELEGLDIHGQKWFSPKVDIKFHQSKDSIITAKFKELYFEKEENELLESFQIYFDEEIRIPQNSRVFEELKKNEKSISLGTKYEVTEFETDDFNVEIVHKKDTPYIYVYPKENKGLDTSLPEKVIDTLRFLTGQLNYKRLLLKEKGNGQSGVFISERHDNYYKPIVKAPINIYNGGTWYSDLPVLFTKYLNFLVEKSQSKMSKILDRCIRGSVGNIYTYAITISFGVEEIIKTYFLEFIDVVEKEKIEKAIHEIEGSNIDEDLKNRIVESIRQFKKPRVIDALYQIEESSSVNKGEIKKWKELRGRVAHPGKKEYEGNELIELIEPSLTLFYSLIFILIGYKGKRTNYFQKWKLEDFDFDDQLTPRPQ